MTLAVISHTDHYIRDGQVVGWGPTVREINHLLQVFDEIWHVAVLHAGEEAPASSLPYASDKIHFVAINASGGKRLGDKLAVLWQMPEVLRTIQHTLQLVDWFQFRAPTGIGNFVIPYLCLFCQKPGWFKYAGNWMQQPAPPGYRWQRWWLAQLQHRSVTINGYWPDQAPHLLSFENPCLTEQEWTEAQQQSRNKRFDQGLTLCFVASLTPNKGARQLLEALTQMKTPPFTRVWIAGDGPEKAQLEHLARRANLAVELTGFQSRTQLNELYAKAHFIILPSDNEGFPKVVPEAGAYGCIPIVTDVSCLGQYIRDGENGYLLADNAVQTIQSTFEKISLQPHDFARMSMAARLMAKVFTYERYGERISKMIHV